MFVIFSMVAILTPEMIFAQVVQITDQWGTVNVKSGEYRVYNNVWGASTPQALSVDTASTYFKVDSTGHNLPSNGAPASYPFILKGSHFNDTPTPMNDPFPIPVVNLHSCPTFWKISGTNAPGVWDCAYDIWFVKNGNNKLEMMIWINYQGPQPTGAQITTTTIDSISWQVWWNGTSTVSYRIVKRQDSCNLDIGNFVKDAVARGYLDTTWNLGAVEAGFEIWQNGSGLTSDSFSVTVGSATKIDSPDDSRPTGFRLEQNYPNPFNPTTKINYELPVSGFVKLRIYDVFGRQVDIMVNEHQSAGVHSVRFDGTSLSSGMYFYSLQSGMYHNTKKLLLLK
jgi:hypothetical protein